MLLFYEAHRRSRDQAAVNQNKNKVSLSPYDSSSSRIRFSRRYRRVIMQQRLMHIQSVVLKWSSHQHWTTRIYGFRHSRVHHALCRAQVGNKRTHLFGYACAKARPNVLARALHVARWRPRHDHGLARMSMGDAGVSGRRIASPFQSSLRNVPHATVARYTRPHVECLKMIRVAQRTSRC